MGPCNAISSALKGGVAWQGGSVDASGIFRRAGRGRGGSGGSGRPGRRAGCRVSAWLSGGAAWSVAGVDVGPAVPPLSVVAAVEAALRPRWVLWSAKTALILARAGIRVALAWDLAAVHRLLFGGWLADPGRVWAAAHGLALEGVPAAAAG